MDPFLQGNDDFKFSIDEIFPEQEDMSIFVARIIPDIKSKLFPPFHLRNIRISSELLEEKYYFSIREKIDKLPESEKFSASILQGGYYVIPKKEIRPYIYDPKKFFTLDNDIFKERVEDSPYPENEVKKSEILSFDDGIRYLASPQRRRQRGTDSLYLYCFNVGQGDSLLIIFPNGNVYLIDTNCYETTLAYYIGEINRILSEHNLKKIKALVITHKHLDHLRGAKESVARTFFK